MRPLVAALALLVLLSLTACDKGDYLGGAERATREALNGWDMWATDAVPVSYTHLRAHET